MNVVCIIQARMQSTRLPGKVLLDICGKTMLQRVVERVSQAGSLNRVIVATSTDQADDDIAAFCNGHKYDYFRGGQDDVLDRYYQCAWEARADVVVRVTGDCPLHDATVIDAVVNTFMLIHDRDSQVAYVSNVYPVPFYPDGLDTEVFTFDALRHAWKQGQQYPLSLRQSNREHVTPYIRDRGVFQTAAHIDLRHGDLSRFRLCVDEQADLDLVRAVYAELGDNPYWLDVVDLLKRRPDLVALNAHIGRNEGYAKSVREDRER